MKMYRPHRLCPRNSKPKEPSLYRSLCVSILCMFLSTVMLVGTTMAWFSDSLQTGVYTISSANFTVTTFFCPDLAGGDGISNNWQRLNPGNTTMFGGGSLHGGDSLSSGSYQTAYLKIVNGSDIPLQYTLAITDGNGNEVETGSTPSLSLAYKVVTDENALRTAFQQDDTNPWIDAKDPFTVPATGTTFVALKLSLNDTAQPDTQYPFGLRLAITQTVPGAQAGEPASTFTPVVSTDIVSTPSTPNITASDAANSSGEVTQQPADENNSGTNNTAPPSGSTTGTEGTTGVSKSDNTGDTGTDTEPPATESSPET